MKKFLEKVFCAEIIPNKFKSILAPKTNFEFFWKKVQKWSKNDQKMSKNEKFRKIFKKIFFSKSIQNGLKRVLKRKSWFRKIFSLKIISGTLSFFDENAKKIEV